MILQIQLEVAFSFKMQLYELWNKKTDLNVPVKLRMTAFLPKKDRSVP